MATTLEAKSIEEIEAIKKQEIALALQQNKALNFLQMREIETGKDIFEAKEVPDIPRLPVPAQKPIKKPESKAKKSKTNNRRNNRRKTRRHQRKNRLRKNRGSRRILKNCWHFAFRKFWRWYKNNKNF